MSLESTLVNGFAVNLDNSHFFVTDCGRTNTKTSLRGWLKEKIPAEASLIVFGVNAQKSSFRSAVLENVSDSIIPEDGYAEVRCWQRSLIALEREGIDPYAVWIDTMRELGKEVGLSVRVNDVHFANDLAYPLHSEFWRVNRDLRLEDSPFIEGWFAESLDYSEVTVAERLIKYVAEIIQKYQPDVLEIDWMRFGVNVSPSRVAGGASLDFIFQELCGLKAQWPDVKFFHRVPFSPEAAMFTGFKIPSRNLVCVDSFVVSPFWTTNSMDLPIGAWRAALDASKHSLHINLYAGLDVNWRASPEATAAKNTAPLISSFGRAMEFRGADELYFFNFLEYREAVVQSIFDHRTDVPVTYFDFPVSIFQKAALPIWVSLQKALPVPELAGLLDQGEGFIRVKLNSPLGLKRLSLRSESTECERSGSHSSEVEFKCRNIRSVPFTLTSSFPVRVEAITYSSYSRF